MSFLNRQKLNDKLILLTYKSLEKYVVENIKSKPDDDKSKRFDDIIEMIKENGKNWSKSIIFVIKKLQRMQ